MTNSIRPFKSGVLQRQRGAALLVLITGLLAATAYATLQLSSANRSRLEQQQEITRSLAFAKNALISYAVAYVDNYGHNIRGGVGRLPCPSKNRYGSPARSCGQNAIGFLPGVWTRDGKRIDIDHLEKFLHQDLWYSLSADFRFNPAYNALNPDSVDNLLSVNNDDEVIAVVMAPGSPVNSQSRAAGIFNIADYLEGENADQDLVFSTTGVGNDRLVTITRSELVPLIERRVLGHARDWLVEYKALYGHFPYAAPFGDPLGQCQQGLTRGKLPMLQGDCSAPPLGDLVSTFVPKDRTINQIWFARSGWPDYIFYHIDENCTADAVIDVCDSIDDPQPSLIVNSAPTQALLVSVGRAIRTELVEEGQLRLATDADTPVDMINYFDIAELLNAELDYDLRRLVSPALSGELSNDQYLVIQE